MEKPTGGPLKDTRVRLSLVEDRVAKPWGHLDNRRGQRRLRVLKRALIVFNSGTCTMRCQILNITAAGAMIRPADMLLCPAEFVLKPEIGQPRNCEVVWRSKTVLGVRYV
jgi:coenzyme F420-reducing hydrogenase gamma subunit